MSRWCCRLVGALTVLASVSGPAQDAFTEFQLLGRKHWKGVSGEPVAFDARFPIVVTARNVTQTGITGWSYGVIAEGGITITDLTDQGTVAADVNDTPPGIRDGGFSLHELTTDGCDGLPGAVATVVLSYDKPVKLPPTDWRLRTPAIGTIRATLSGITPPRPNSVPIGVLRFVDGCQGSGDPVFNRVMIGNTSMDSDHGPYEITLSGGLEDCAPRSCADLEEALELHFEDARTSEAPSSGCPHDPARLDISDMPPGEVASKDVFVRLASRRLEHGVQGWSLSLAVSTGDIKITEAHHRGTVSAEVTDDPPGLVDTGFTFVETARGEPDDGTECAGAPSVLQAIVFSLIKPIELEPESDYRILALTVETTLPVPPPLDEETPGEITGQIEFLDGCRGSGSPIHSNATVSGQTVDFDCMQAVRVAFQSELPPGERSFLRCDANDDARFDLADAIWIINDLFRNGPETTCRIAMDCNGDGRGDISDALYAAQSLFGLASPVPGGGVCETASPDLCEVASRACQ